MAVCPVCGCKTEDIDMVMSSLGGNEKTICSFCQRQLHTIEGEEKLTEAQLRWLSAVVNKQVSQRDEETFSALKDLYTKHKNDVPQGEDKTAADSENADDSATKVLKGDNERDEIINELIEKVDNLEKEIATMKRKQIIKTIIELGVPIILLILILIIFFSSGLFDALAGIFYEFNNL